MALGQIVYLLMFHDILERGTSYIEDKNLVFVAYSNPEVANYNTYISYDFLSLVGEVGGILGLTLGVSILTLFESLLHDLPHYWIGFLRTDGPIRKISFEKLYR